jgi:AraC family ethanolamine operon transcriptional activator
MPEQVARFRKTLSEDADAHAESLEKWQQSYDQLTAGRFHGVLREIWLGDMQLFRETTNQAVLQRGRAWSGAGTFGVPLDMDADGFFCGQVLGINGILSFGQNQNFELRTPRSFDVVGIAVNANCYRSIVEPTPTELPDEQTGKPRVLPCNEHLRELRALLVDIFDALDADPLRLEAPQIQKTLRSALVGHLQASVPPMSTMPAPLPNSFARKAIVERARDHVLGNLHEPVTIGELCEHLGISRRTLQYCFQEVIGTNPVDFLRAIRLNSVRRELRAASHGSLQIADVAARWGFWHLSHFASDYRAMFGELPSDTLKRS